MNASHFIVVTVRDAQGRQIAHERLSQFPATLGRAPACTLMLNDPFVAAEHAEVTLDEHGYPVIRDLGSVNGLVCLDPNKRVFRLGQTEIQLHCPIDPIADELSLQKPTPTVAKKFGPQWFQALLAVALLLLGFGFEVWFDAPQETKWVQHLSSGAGFMVGLALFAGCWALYTRISTGISRYWQHLQWFCIMLIAIGLFAQLTGVVAYVFNLPVLVKMNDLLTKCLLAILLIGHLKIAHHDLSKRTVTVILSLLLANLIFEAVLTYQKYDQPWPSSFMSNTSPASWRLAPTVAPSVLLEEVKLLAPRLDRLRKEESDELPYVYVDD